MFVCVEGGGGRRECVRLFQWLLTVCVHPSVIRAHTLSGIQHIQIPVSNELDFNLISCLLFTVLDDAEQLSLAEVRPWLK